MKLNELRDNDGARPDKKRLGRGIGSGKGKTSGRGVKGQKSRSGSSIGGFEGGQMPIYRRLPKRGFTNIFAKEIATVNVGMIQKFIDEKRLDATKEINVEALVQAGLLRSTKLPVKVLGRGDLKAKINLHVNAFSESAKQLVEKAGGSLTLVA
ncbi:MAG: 50S ribosomal protein L15 [Candidatus Paracaedibacteraceae bacterium]|nr:50S ribosomal protein L15 [Candidatus Paracaedibacteraceae bacterium]